MGRLVLVLILLGSVTGAQAATVTLAWTDNSNNEQGFDVERKAEACAGTTQTSAKIGSVAANVKTYADAAVTQGTTYCYRVDAFNTAGKSAYSNTVEIAVPFTIPAAPSALGAVAGP